MVANTAALVLAGGHSRRMGQDKALLPWPTGGATPHKPAPTLLQRVCTVAQACSAVTYVLTPWPERYGHLLPDSVVLLSESPTGEGPLGALAQGWSRVIEDAQVRHLPVPDWLMVLACDMPALDIATLQKWRQDLEGHTASSQPRRAMACLPRHQDRWEPLCGFYHRRCMPSLENALANNVRSFQRWLTAEQDQVIPLSVEDSHILQNCNTPGQWQQFLDSSGDRNPYTA